jgi:hypothetical protein
MHMVPKGFKLPTSCSTRDLFVLFFLGNPSENYRPYRFLTWHDFDHASVDTSQLTKYRKIMYCIARAAVRGEAAETVRDIELMMDAAKLQAVFDIGYIEFLNHLKIDAKGLSKSFYTLANNTCGIPNPKRNSLQHCDICHG